MNANTRRGLITILIMLAGTFVLAELLLARPTTDTPTGLTVASKRTKDLVITITSADGHLKGGENSFCVVFHLNYAHFFDLNPV